MTWFQGKPKGAGITLAFNTVQPKAPTGLVATAVSTSQINLTWNASSDPGGPGLKDYGVYRQGFGLVAYVAGLSCNDTGLTPSTAYTYWVTARDTQLLESAISATAFATTQGAAGGLTHGQPVTFSGSGFGTKSRGLAPLVWDPGTGVVNTVDPQWNGGHEPSTAGGIYNIQLQNVGFQPSSYAIGAPHAYVSKIYAGCHLNLNTATGGNDVFLGFTFAPPAYPYCLRGEWYYRFDPGWLFDPTSDNNLKDINWNDSNSTYPASGDFFYTNWPALPNAQVPGCPTTISGITRAANAGVTLSTAQAQNPFATVYNGINGNVWYFSAIAGMTQMNGLYGTILSIGGSFGAWTATFNIDSSAFSPYTSGGFASHPYNNGTLSAGCGTDAFANNAFFQGPNDANGHNTSFWNSMLYPMNPTTGWIKRRWEMCVTNTLGAGYCRIYDNNVLVMNYAGKTDNTSAPTTRQFTLGNYSRDRGATNFRYFIQGHCDVSGPGVSGACACPFVGDNPVFNNCTVLEPQIPDSWADGSIHIPAFWKGKLQGGTTGYKFVQTEAGAVVSAGSATISSSP